MRKADKHGILHENETYDHSYNRPERKEADIDKHLIMLQRLVNIINIITYHDLYDHFYMMTN